MGVGKEERVEEGTLGEMGLRLLFFEIVDSVWHDELCMYDGNGVNGELCCY